MRRILPVLIVAFFALPSLALAAGREDHAGVGQTIVIEENAVAGDIACAFCKVIIRGTVEGDVAVAFGSLQLAPGRTISGDVATFGTRVRLEEGSIIGGDLASVGGSYAEAGATVDGERFVSPGDGWILLLLAPLFLIAGFVWLIVHTIRNRSYNPPPPYRMPPVR